MRIISSSLFLACLPPLLGACAAVDEKGPEKESNAKGGDHALVADGNANIFAQGTIEFGGAIPIDSPAAQIGAGESHGYEFNGKAGGVVTITQTAKSCGDPDTEVYLFGPENTSGLRGAELTHNDDANGSACSTDSVIQSFTLPVDGEYLIVASTFFDEGGNGTYGLTLDCDNAACDLPGAMTFATSRISQAQIDSGAFTPSQVFDVGDFLFEHNYSVAEGLGNGVLGAPGGNNPVPNMRKVHFGAFGGPEATSCISCHNEGGQDGAGGLKSNIFQIGDGVNKSSGVERNPPSMLGLGYRQQLGTEMTADLKAQLAAGKAAAASAGVPQTVALTTKGVSFGSIIANPDGTVDATGVQGVDADLVVRPFGWKGREATLRRFVEGGFRVHFGMQTEPSVNGHCATPNTATFGTGTDCQDPDDDGVKQEITDGQLTAMALYSSMLQAPVRIPPATQAGQLAAQQGEALFAQVGCTTCHVPTMTLASPVHTELGDTTTGPGITFDLRTDTEAPRPTINQDGSMTIELWSDSKRHDMGPALADSKPFKNIAANQFVTMPLWGVATSAPYLHDGRAPTLQAAIAAHGGEAAQSSAAFAALTAADQQKVITFLGTLGREVEVTPGVDLSGFRLKQTKASLSFALPQGTSVPHGGYVIVARDATQAQFESFYGVTLGSNVKFIDSNGAFPNVNGSETYELVDANGASVDGPTVPEPTAGAKNFQRKSPPAAAGLGSSWTSRKASSFAATPGSGQTDSGAGKIYISEFTDVPGGSFFFEFVEVFVE